MSEVIIILKNMRGGCATVGGTVHTLFRVNDRRRGGLARDVTNDAGTEAERTGGTAAPASAL